MGFEGTYDRLRTRVGLIFSPVPVPPSAWTVLAVLLAIAGFYAMTQQLLGIAFWLFIASGVVDVIDGGVARVRKGETAFGAWLDDISDKSREILLFFGLFFISFPLPQIWIILLILLSFAIDYLKLHGLYRGLLTHEEIEEAPGRIERVERVLVVLAGMLVYGISADYLSYAVEISLLLAVLRVLQAVGYIYPKKEKKERVGQLRRMIR